MRELLAALPSQPNSDWQPLVELVKDLRQNPSRRLDELCTILETDPNLSAKFGQFMVNLLKNSSHLRLLTELGLSTNHGFFHELSKRIGEWFLPPVGPPNASLTALASIFSKKNDHVWVEKISDDTWARLFSHIPFQHEHSPFLPDELDEQLTSAMFLLAARISSLGLEKELIDRLPGVEKLRSPFLRLPAEINFYIELLMKKSDDLTALHEHFRQANIIIRQCHEHVAVVQRSQERDGTSVRIIYLLMRIRQNLDRLKTLLEFTEPVEANEKPQKTARFFKKLVEAEHQKHSIRSLVNENTSLLARQIVEHTSQKGEHYITTTAREYWQFFWRSGGGGLVVAFVTLLKFKTYYLHLAPVPEALAYGLNYALGFILIYILHFTLATKQPAMTASALAASIDPNDRRRDLDGAAELIVKLSRSQFVSFVGNLLVVFPVAIGLAWLWKNQTGQFLVDAHKAETVFSEVAFSLKNLWFAGLAGVCLFTSGLISGYYENVVNRAQIPERLRKHPFLRRFLSKNRLNRFANYIDDHLGGLMGNFVLGFMLAFLGMFGKILGLPLDVRHVTLSTGNFAMALVTDGDHQKMELLESCVLGIVGIGLLNFLVSFGLSLGLALRSRKADFRLMRELVWRVLAHFFYRPWQFFFPPNN